MEKQVCFGFTKSPADIDNVKTARCKHHGHIFFHNPVRLVVDSASSICPPSDPGEGGSESELKSSFNGTAMYPDIFLVFSVQEWWRGLQRREGGCDGKVHGPQPAV